MKTNTSDELHLKLSRHPDGEVFIEQVIGADDETLRIGYEVGRERLRQDEEWGGPEHDDRHDLWDWCNYIDKQLGKARKQAISTTVWEIPELAVVLNEFEGRMIKIAALAVAAIQSSRRKRKWMERRS